MTATNIQLSNQGSFYLSGNINLAGSTVNNDGLISSDSNMDLSDSTIINSQGGQLTFLE